MFVYAWIYRLICKAGGVRERYEGQDIGQVGGMGSVRTIRSYGSSSMGGFRVC